MTQNPTNEGGDLESTKASQIAQDPGEALSPPPRLEELFLSPDAVPRRKNQLLAAGLAGIAVIMLILVVVLMLLIRYDNLPSLFSYFT